MINELIDKIIFIEENAVNKANEINLSIDDKKADLVKKIESEQKYKLNAEYKNFENELLKLNDETNKNADLEARKTYDMAEKNISKAKDFVIDVLMKIAVK
ncbi:MAG: hypothetical protein FWE03_02280 [Firmicutes bacterium]|nr:hypothetical protein [Bacillota bacterium]